MQDSALCSSVTSVIRLLFAQTLTTVVRTFAVAIPTWRSPRHRTTAPHYHYSVHVALCAPPNRQSTSANRQRSLTHTSSHVDVWCLLGKWYHAGAVGLLPYRLPLRTADADLPATRPTPPLPSSSAYLSVSTLYTAGTHAMAVRNLQRTPHASHQRERRAAVKMPPART